MKWIKANQLTDGYWWMLLKDKKTSLYLIEVVNNGTAYHKMNDGFLYAGFFNAETRFWPIDLPPYKELKNEQ